MTREDPYSPAGKRFECRDCGHRLTAGTGVPACPNCGSEMQNIAVPRE